ncbi:MAG TPA: 50S ribosomal protein L6 [Chloroflexota bacterium]|jgi:large subunit ribosomal protein L6|nr:50S ribosomal protein L6 [Chloroflexota bacterium]
MSRIGRMPIDVPSGVEVSIGENNHVVVKGPRGTLARTLDANLQFVREDGSIVVARPNDERRSRSMHGLSRTLLANMVTGVTSGFEKRLEITGTGYRAQGGGTALTLQMGFSHPVQVAAPDGITFEVEGTTRVIVKGIDKEVVGQVAANIRKVRPPEPYKGKGIRYADEQVRRKPGKAGAKK